MAELAGAVIARARAAGLDAAGIAHAAPFARTRADLERRRAQGLAAGMQFTYRNPGRSTDPARSLPGAAALVVGALGYAEPAPPRPDGGPAGRVARYAWRDHYADLRAALDQVAGVLRAAGWRARVVVDDNGLVDREAALRAGIGRYGKNANVLLPGRGSWFVLGAVVTDAPLPPSVPDVPDLCGTCNRCIDGCPTGAIVAPGVVDARRCLAWLVQAPGPIPREHRAALADRIYGCDDCQEVCPPNRAGQRRPTAPRPAAGEGAAPDDVWPSIAWLLSATDAELLDRHGRWYIAQRDPDHLRRNALVALGNVGDAADPATVDLVRRYLRSARPMLRAHAVWAARRLGLDHLLDGVRGDADPEIRAELEATVERRDRLSPERCGAGAAGPAITRVRRVAAEERADSVEPPRPA
ncbi:MAG: tRNA epoxyqueuosine(34) reductase QueG [Actinobacteria bacterium]|nr:tRNA epoxyqueuosine(34) reductase QueG [Actinomycetota bacterium]